jgi:hypothetical protein
MPFWEKYSAGARDSPLPMGVSPCWRSPAFIRGRGLPLCICSTSSNTATHPPPVASDGAEIARTRAD